MYDTIVFNNHNNSNVPDIPHQLPGLKWVYTLLLWVSEQRNSFRVGRDTSKPEPF